MKFALFALRNLARNRRRTAISLAIVAAGTVGLLLTAGFIRFSFDGLREAMIHGGLGHLEIASQAAVASRGEAALDRSVQQGIDGWQEVRATVEKLPHVVAVQANLHLMGMIQKPGGDSVSFVGVGVEPERERRMGFETKVRQGRALADATPAAGDDEVVLALGLAAALGARPGDLLTLLAASPDGMLNALDVRVAGLVTTGVQELDSRYLKIHLATGQRLLATDRVSNLLVGLDDTAATAAAQVAVTQALASFSPALAVTPWEKRAAFYSQVRNLYLGIFWFLGAIVFVLVVLATSNTLVMTVMERVREIGTLRAIGTAPGQIAAMVLWEALWLGVLGALVGDALGAAAIAGINGLHLKMPPPPGAVDPIDLQLAFVPEAFAAIVGVMAVVLLVAALAPVARATRISVVEALRHV
ncbi:MAG: FtsX-like permease family protein [Thermoanaerobaculia bacterium]